MENYIFRKPPPPKTISGTDILNGIIGLILFAGAVYFAGMKYTDIQNGDVATLSGPVTQSPGIFTSSKKVKSITLALQNYHDFDFILIGDGFKAGKPTDIAAHVAKGDSLHIRVLKKDLAKAQLPKSQQKAWDTRLYIYGLSDKYHEYLALADYNREAAKEIAFTRNFVPIILVLLGLFFCRAWIRLGIRRLRGK